MSNKLNGSALMESTKAQVRVNRLILDLQKAPHNLCLRLQKKIRLLWDKKKGLL